MLTDGRWDLTAVSWEKAVGLFLVTLSVYASELARTGSAFINPLRVGMGCTNLSHLCPSGLAAAATVRAARRHQLGKPMAARTLIHQFFIDWGDLTLYTQNRPA
jgi:hypothetical protein